MKAATLSLLVLLALLLIAEGASAHLVTDKNLPKAQPYAAISSSSKVKPWCGTTTNQDQAPTSSRQVFKMVLAYPSDGYDNTVASGIDPVEPYGQNIENAVRRAEAYIAKSTGGKKTLRFDRGTSCSKSSVDIATIRLPVDSATLNNAYRRSPYSIDRYLDEAAASQLGLRNSNTHYVVWVEGLIDVSSWGWATIGGDPTIIIGEPMATNPVRYTYVLLHEVFHTLKAVNPTAPFATPGWHCRQKLDLMCYDDKTVIGAPAIIPGLCFKSFYGVEGLDCRGEDYFNMRPVAGSWLANNPARNTYLSPAMASCSERRSACKPFQLPRGRR